MNNLSTLISFVREKRKILISLFLVLGFLAALVDVVILLQHPQTYLSKASSSEVIFKNSFEETLPVNKKGYPVSEFSGVIVELNPKLPPKSYKIGENQLELNENQPKPYENPPVKFPYEFKIVNNNLATLLVEFIYSDGTSRKVTSLIQTGSLSTEDTGQDNYTEFLSPQGKYKVYFDQRQWGVVTAPDETLGSRVVFNLNKEYGSARLDIIEGESQKDLNSLKDEIIGKSPLPPVSIETAEFNGLPSYLISYKEDILGSDVHYSQEIVKNENVFFILEKRVPQLGYNIAFLDNLLQNISFAGPNTSVQGASSATTDLSTVQLVDLVRPSVANIVYIYCLEITNLKPQLSGLLRPTYNFCASGKGSGFIVSEDGVVATNGHVAKTYPEESLVANLLSENNKLFSSDLIRSIYLSKGQNAAQSEIEDFYKEMNVNPQYLDRFLTEIFRMIQDKLIAVNIINEKYYINVGSEPATVDYQKLNQGDYTNAVVPSSTTYTAKFIDFNYPNRYSYDAIVGKNYKRGADVALLKIENSSNLFPALELGSTEGLREGSNIIVAGYPTLVEGSQDPRAAISYKTSTKPTITQGIVSSVKEDLTGSTILQTDASIDHGNSGGPAFNSNGEVIGIATFATESQTGNFNFLRDVNELRELMSKNNIENKIANLSHSWRKGLESFRSQRYGEAVKYFKEVESLNPSHPTAKEFIERSQKAIAKGESLEGIAGLIRGQGADILLVVFGILSITSFMLAGFLAILPLFEKRPTSTATPL